ncbi:MAG: CDP-diacylglycerol--serine O-phosphatidyltransferase [Alphaproteobacteria bacterium]|nr:CDP-diacylglycerol--serine O-phosphatidyltransferase [Alphaproteobacteria bacterium]
MGSQTRARLQGLHFNRLIPNILTVLALCAGLTAILYGFQGKWKFAVLAIVLAAVLDILDGRVARLLGGSTKFGAELDSLSDFVSFGVAPALLVFLWSLAGGHPIGWVITLAFVVCAALRLARFNTRLGDTDMPAWASNFFTGVPAPAGGGLVLLPMILSFDLPYAALAHPILNIPIMIGVAILMISRIPTYSVKQLRVPHRYVMPFLLLVGLYAALLAVETWLTLAASLIAYLVSLVLSVRSYRARAKAAALAGEAGMTPSGDGDDRAPDADRVFEEIAEGPSAGAYDDGEDEGEDEGESEGESEDGPRRD